MNHYKSWSGLKNQLTECLCDSLKGRVTYFLTRYHTVHNSYGRASIRLDGDDLVTFTWFDETRQERDTYERWQAIGVWDSEAWELHNKWEKEGIISDRDFLQAATDFLEMPIEDALNSDNCLFRIFAIMDRRVGKRTIQKIQNKEIYKTYPDWVQQFYLLRFDSLKRDFSRGKRTEKI